MKPYYDVDGVTIYHGDCRDVLPGLEVAADALATDPPYGIGFADYESHRDDPCAYGDLLLPAIERSEALIAAGWCAVFQSATTAGKWSEAIPRQWRPVALPKTFTQVHPGRNPLWATDYALLWSIGEPAWPTKGRRVRDWCLVPTSNMLLRVKGHPCPRPLGAMLHIVTMVCAPGGLVLDPFMGSGTTLVAAKDLGRKAVGIEIEERYCEIAAERLAQTVMELEA